MNLKIVNSDDVEIAIANAQKPTAFSNYKYPLNDLDDRIFEILTYSIFKRRIDFKDHLLIEKIDSVELMHGVGDKGMDCIFRKGTKIVGVIQCKKYSRNITDKIILHELIKFALFYYINRHQFSLPKNFRYIFATSTGFSEKALKLSVSFSDKNFHEKYEIEELVTRTIDKYKEFKNIVFDEIRDEIFSLISDFEYEFFRPSDYNLWINNFPEINETFFQVRSIADNSVVVAKGDEVVERVQTILSKKDEVVYETFLAKYHSALIEKLNTVNFIGFDLHRYRHKPTEITLTDLFVKPSFRKRLIEKGKRITLAQDRELKITNVFSSDKNIIILGDPGAGKSLLVKYIMIHIAMGSAERIGLRQFNKSIPFRIELRKYSECRTKKSIVTYLSENLSSEYQTTVSAELLDSIIQKENSIMFFDGLDEIFNVSHKNKMKEAIEIFSVNYPKTKCIVTSRFIGYHDISFDPKKFDEYSIQQFAKEQIEELTSKFYATQIGNTERRQIAIENCLAQVDKHVDIELKSNPLIMTLVLILTINNIVIPDSKLEIYEACTKTLVDSIDIKVKELAIDMPVKNKRLTFAHLAYWQYEASSNGTPIRFDNAVRTIADLLVERKEVRDYLDAEDKAKRFLDYAEKRSIYFEDNFTHKTFLEYYTADYLYITFFTKASDTAKLKAIELITKYLPKAFWYVVFELLLTRIDKEQADSDLLDEIFRRQLESGSLNVYYFLISNLPRFINVSDDIRYQIIKKTLLLCIRGEKITEIRWTSGIDEKSLLAKIYLLQTNEALYQILSSVLFDLEHDNLAEKDLIELYNLYYEIISLEYRIDFENRLSITNASQLKELSYKDLSLYRHVNATWSVGEELVSIKSLTEQIENFGTKSLFKDLQYRHRPHVYKINTFDYFFIAMLEYNKFKELVSAYNTLLSSGLKHRQTIEHIKTSNAVFYRRPEDFEKMLRFYLRSEDRYIDEIILTYLNRAIGMKMVYERFRSMSENPKLKIIDRIFGYRKSSR